MPAAVARAPAPTRIHPTVRLSTHSKYHAVQIVDNLGLAGDPGSMLTAIDTATDRATFLLYGTELGASGQIERLQQALQALAKTGLPLANPVIGVLVGYVALRAAEAETASAQHARKLIRSRVP